MTYKLYNDLSLKYHLLQQRNTFIDDDFGEDCKIWTRLSLSFKYKQKGMSVTQGLQVWTCYQKPA